MLIRPHSTEDAGRVAEILADGWRQAYSSFMPPEILSRNTDRARRRSEIAEWFAEFDAANEAVFVAQIDRDLVGFIHMEKGDKGELGATAAVNLLYVDEAAQGCRVGRALMAAGAAWQHERAPGPLVVSAFRDNPFRGAYAAMGASEALERVHDIEGRRIVSVLYLWSDPSVLLGEIAGTAV